MYVCVCVVVSQCSLELHALNMRSEKLQHPVAGVLSYPAAGRGPENPGIAPEEALQHPVAGVLSYPAAGRGPKNPGVAP